jgi:L-fuconolactonase
VTVETHVHIVAGDEQKFPRQVGAQPGWVRTMTAEDLLGFMDQAGVERAVLVQGYSAYKDDNSYVADAVARYPKRFAGVGVIDPTRADGPEKLSYWITERGLRGVRLMLRANEMPIDDPGVVPVLARAADLGIPVCIITGVAQLKTVAAFLQRFPGLPIALDHIAYPELAAGVPYDVARPLFELARYANCYLKFSSETLYEAARGKSTIADFFPRLIEHFGAQRLMWGSNFPATHDRTYQGLVEFARTELRFLSDEDRRWIFGETALTLWPMLRD